MTSKHKETPDPIEREGKGSSCASPSAAPHGATSDTEPSAPYRPVAIHYAEADTLEFVERDVPTVAFPSYAGLDVLVDMASRKPIGWRVYGWSRIAPPQPHVATEAELSGPFLRHQLHMGRLGSGPVFDALACMDTLVTYGRWQVGPESLSHHPTLPSAVAAAGAALDAALKALAKASGQ